MKLRSYLAMICGAGASAPPWTWPAASMMVAVRAARALPIVDFPIVVSQFIKKFIYPNCPPCRSCVGAECHRAKCSPPGTEIGDGSGFASESAKRRAGKPRVDNTILSVLFTLFVAGALAATLWRVTRDSSRNGMTGVLHGGRKPAGQYRSPQPIGHVQDSLKP